jgi:hypothetical protein
MGVYENKNKNDKIFPQFRIENYKNNLCALHVDEFFNCKEKVIRNGFGPNSIQKLTLGLS